MSTQTDESTQRPTESRTDAQAGAGGEFWRDYEKLPGPVKANLTADRWEEAQARVVPQGAAVPDAAVYLNLKNGQMVRMETAATAHAPLLAVHNLAGGRGRDSEQFSTVPEGAPEALQPPR